MEKKDIENTINNLPFKYNIWDKPLVDIKVLLNELYQSILYISKKYKDDNRLLQMDFEKAIKSYSILEEDYNNLINISEHTFIHDLLSDPIKQEKGCGFLINKDVTSINFNFMSDIYKLIIPNQITSFRGYIKKCQDLYLPDTLTEFYSWSFKNVQNLYLNSLDILANSINSSKPELSSSYSNQYIYLNGEKINDLHLNWETVNEGLFYNLVCNNVYVNSKVIKKSAFQGANIKNFTIGENIEEIEESAIPTNTNYIIKKFSAPIFKKAWTGVGTATNYTITVPTGAVGFEEGEWKVLQDQYDHTLIYSDELAAELNGETTN